MSDQDHPDTPVLDMSRYYRPSDCCPTCRGIGRDRKGSCIMCEGTGVRHPLPEDD